MHIAISRRIVRSAVIALSIAALAGCSMFSSPNPRYEPAALTEYPAGISAHIAWSVSIGSGGGYGFAPTLVEEAVYAATPNGNISKLNATSGAVLWQSNAGVKLSAGVGSDGRTTAVAAGDGTVIAFDDQGAEKWRSKEIGRDN